MYRDSTDSTEDETLCPANNVRSKRTRAKAAAPGLKYKTELCRNWLEGGCEYQSKCSFAHGTEELRQPQTRSENYRSKACRQFFEAGYCMYGGRCQFRHTVRREAERLQVFVQLQERGEKEKP